MDDIKIIEKTSVFVRVDDLGIDDLPNIRDIVTICKDNTIPVILAVIPDKLSEETAKFLRKEMYKGWPGLIIAQHGVTHIPYTGYIKKIEFSLHEPVENIIEKLTLGRKILFEKLGITTGWYVPPWNKFGQNLITALEKMNYYAFSASTRIPFHSQSLVNFPINLDVVKDYLTGESETDPEKWYDETKRVLVSQGRCGLMLHHHLMQKSHIESLQKWATLFSTENKNEYIMGS